MLVRKCNEVIELSKGCIPVGIFEPPTMEVGEERFEAGDLLYMYTDGVMEQHNRADEMFGEARIREVLLRHCNGDLAELLDTIFDAVVTFADGRPLEDDISQMVVRFR
jgi:sigma-B regulation protein RsbU (phosphoserine phosphatase)